MIENLSSTSVKSYELQERIGSGGFGAVYKAHQTMINREFTLLYEDQSRELKFFRGRFPRKLTEFANHQFGRCNNCYSDKSQSP